MRYLSVCSGIEAATVAWHPLGWVPAAFSEIDKFPRALLEHHYPAVPLHGDFTTIRGDEHGPIDLLVGGTPCQDFSIAGLRAGIAGERGNLTLEFLRLAARVAPRWIVWENVPGVLSSDGGRALGSFLGGLAQLGYGFAYRVLDAQYFSLAQRRARVFVVSHSRDWRRAAAVLFERESLQGNPAPRREAGEGVAPTISARPTGGGGLGTDFDCDGGLIASLDLNNMGEGGNIGWQPPGGPTKANYSNPQPGDPCHPLAAGAHPPAIAGTQVRRLTPRECERLQGFPDDYTLIPWRGGMAPDGPRYKALGNSMAVPVMRWIGERIAMVDAILTAEAAA